MAYGLQGKTTILTAKKENFSQNLPESGTAYEVNNFLCDPDNRSDYILDPSEERLRRFLYFRMVSFTFQCFLQGQEGRGTEMVFFNEDGLIENIKCFRHKI